MLASQQRPAEVKEEPVEVKQEEGPEAKKIKSENA